MPLGQTWPEESSCSHEAGKLNLTFPQQALRQRPQQSGPCALRWARQQLGGGDGKTSGPARQALRRLMGGSLACLPSVPGGGFALTAGTNRTL